jgi:uncharacterized protein (TIGR02611 family)
MFEHLTRDIDSGSDPRHPLRRALVALRHWVGGHRYLLLVYRLGVGLLGTIIIVVGLVLVPLPGPGWLIVFLGVAVLGTEFASAHRLGIFLKGIVTRVLAWWRTRRYSRMASSS